MASKLLEGSRLLDDLLRAGVTCQGILVSVSLGGTTEHCRSQLLRHNNPRCFPALSGVRLRRFCLLHSCLLDTFMLIAASFFLTTMALSLVHLPLFPLLPLTTLFPHPVHTMILPGSLALGRM